MRQLQLPGPHLTEDVIGYLHRLYEVVLELFGHTSGALSIDAA